MRFAYPRNTLSEGFSLGNAVSVVAKVTVCLLASISFDTSIYYGIDALYVKYKMVLSVL